MAKIPQCPKCSTPLNEDDYGMVTCPNCASVLFVDMEGNASAEMTLAGSTTEPVATSEPNSKMFGLPPLASATESPIPENPVENFMESFDIDSSQEESVQNETDQSERAHIDPSDPLGISAYANSEVSSGKDGPFVLTVFVSGIDTKDLREDIRKAIQDSRFGWDDRALMSGIHNGILKIENINPIKASIVINRLKSLPVQIRWEQNAITEIDIEKEDLE